VLLRNQKRIGCPRRTEIDARCIPRILGNKERQRDERQTELERAAVSSLLKCNKGVAGYGRTVSLSSVVSTYDWVGDEGYVNFAAWVEAAARAAGR
jgi:hypothetical protein